MNFEESLNRLEEITGLLEKGDMSLDESLKIFEEGVRLGRFCEKKLSEAEHKIEILKSADIPEAFEVENKSEENKSVSLPAKESENIEYSEDVENAISEEKKTSAKKSDKAGKTKKTSEETNLLF